LLSRFDDQFDSKMDTLNQNIHSFFSETQMNVNRMKSASRDAIAAAAEHREQSKNLLIAFGAIGFLVFVISLLSAWIFREPFLISEWGCAVIGGEHQVSALGNYCMINAW